MVVLVLGYALAKYQNLIIDDFEFFSEAQEKQNICYVLRIDTYFFKFGRVRNESFLFQTYLGFFHQHCCCNIIFF